ncbi:unnamed protein product, partial [Rotaria sp. Silwood2]
GIEDNVSNLDTEFTSEGSILTSPENASCISEGTRTIRRHNIIQS